MHFLWFRPFPPFPPIKKGIFGQTRKMPSGLLTPDPSRSGKSKLPSGSRFTARIVSPSIRFQADPSAPPKPAFRMDHLPRDPFGLLSGEKSDKPGGVLRLTDPSGRKAGQQIPFQVIGHPSRIRRTRIDGIDRDSPGRDLGGKGGGESFHGSLGGRIGDFPRHRTEGLAGGEI